MPRATSRRSTTAGTSKEVLGTDDRKALALGIEASGFGPEKADAFADAANRAAVFAYVLEPLLSTSGESRAWAEAVVSAARGKRFDRLLELARVAGDPDAAVTLGDADLDLAALARDLAGSPERKARAAAILQAHCKAEVRRPARPARRTSSARQSLAATLVREWRVHFDTAPSYRLGAGDEVPIFLSVLDRVIVCAEGRDRKPELTLTKDALHALTKRACAADRRRVAQEPQTPV